MQLHKDYVHLVFQPQLLFEWKPVRRFPISFHLLSPYWEGIAWSGRESTEGYLRKRKN